MYNKTDAATFTKTRNQMPTRLSVFLTDYTAADYKDAACYLSDDHKSGYAIKADGDIVSVFSLPGASQGYNAVKSAIENGAKKLDCFDGFLVTFYKAFGFFEINREPWNEDYAPVNWDYIQHGTPDIVYMQLE